MPLPSYGAAPLAKTFIFIRALSLVAMIAVVGLTANFVSEIVTTKVDPPRVIVGTLTITCLATLYCLISIPFFWAEGNLTLLVMTALDSALLLAFVIVAVLLGKPLSFLNCMAIDDASAAANAQGASAFTQSLASNFGKSGSALDLGNWAGSTRATCFETKTIWDLCIVLCIFFTCSALILPALWFKSRKALQGSGKSVV